MQDPTLLVNIRLGFLVQTSKSRQQEQSGAQHRLEPSIRWSLAQGGAQHWVELSIGWSLALGGAQHRVEPSIGWSLAQGGAPSLYQNCYYILEQAVTSNIANLGAQHRVVPLLCTRNASIYYTSIPNWQIQELTLRWLCPMCVPALLTNIRLGCNFKLSKSRNQPRGGAPSTYKNCQYILDQAVTSNQFRSLL